MGVIYEISNSIDGRVYIGSTINLHKRWNEHKRNLLNNKDVLFSKLNLFDENCHPQPELIQMLKSLT